MTGRARRILVVNPNTSQAVTAAYVNALTGDLPGDVVLSGVTGAFGARIVSNAAENVVAAYAALSLVAQHGAGCDAIILAISFDSGLEALRAVLPVPVVGITEAALMAASAGGRPLGVVFLGEASRQLYETRIAGYGHTPLRCHAIEVSSVADYLAPQKLDDAVADAVRDLKAEGAEAVAICGTAIVGMARRLQPRVALPLFDGREALGLCLERMDSVQAPRDAGPVSVGPSENMAPDLARLIAGGWLEPQR